MIQVLLARLGAALGGVETRHWVAAAGSAVLHLGVWLGMSGAQVTPAPETPAMTFEVKLVEPEKPKQIAKATPQKVKKPRPKREKKEKPAQREPHTLQAQWRGEAKPAENAPAVSLPEARAIGVEVAGPAAEAKPALAKAIPVKPSSAKPDQATDKAAELASGAGQSNTDSSGMSAPGQEPGIALAAASHLGQAKNAPGASGAQGSAGAEGAAAAGRPGGDALAASAAGGGSLNRVVGGVGGEAARGGDTSQQNPGGVASGEPSGLRLALTGMLSSLAPLPAGGGSLAPGQLDGSVGRAAAMGEGAAQRFASAAAGKPAGIAVAGATRSGTGGGDAATGSPSAAKSGGGAGGELSGAVVAAPQIAGKPGTAKAGEAGGEASAPALVSAVTLAQTGKGGFGQSGAGKGQAPVAGQTGAGAAEAGSRQGLAAAGAAGAGKMAQAKQAGAGVDPIFLARERGRVRQVDAGSGGAAAGDKPGAGRGNLAAATRQVGQGASADKTAGGGMTVDLAEGGGRGAGGGGQGGSWGWLVNARGSGAALTGKTGSGAVASGKAGSAALTPGEPGSAPGLAMNMPVVPAVLEMRGEGGRAAYRGKADEGAGAAGVQGSSAVLAVSPDSGGASLPGEGKARSVVAAPTRDAGLGGSGGRLASAGKLGEIRNAPVRQVRVDSQARPLDVLAPSTYCPLPFHATPDNRPKPGEKDVVEKPSYANGNMNFTFPVRAWAYGHQGRAIVRVEVRADGTPGRMWVKQSSGSGILDADAQEQLGKTRFQPARKNGQPVSAWIDVPVDYRLHAETKP